MADQLDLTVTEIKEFGLEGSGGSSALRLLADHGVRVARTYGLVELTPNQEYMLVTEFFEHARNLGDSEIDDVVIDEGLGMVRTFWDIGVAHRDIKPANLLVRGGRRWTSPTCCSPWRCGPTASGSTPAPPRCSRPRRSPRPARPRWA
jgi:hypothetical protein